MTRSGALRAGAPADHRSWTEQALETLPESASGALLIDLAALASNWRAIAAAVAPADAGAVVKADAYGLGMAQVAPALARAGCRSFLVAQLEEGLALRNLLPDAEIVVLAGLQRAAPALFRQHRLLPALIDRGEIAAWLPSAQEARPDALLHIDTGLNRLGLPPSEWRDLAQDPAVTRYPWRAVMSHLACGSDLGHPMNAEQRTQFLEATKALPGIPRSLAASDGIRLGAAYHFDLVRPGYMLYGGGAASLGETPIELRQVVHFLGKILQVRQIDRGESVGYGARHSAERPSRCATLGVGYADGVFRSSSPRGAVSIAGHQAPIIGVVSMDLVTIDVTDLPENLAQPGQWAELIGVHRPLDAVAAAAGTIGYEVLTALSPRTLRLYRD